MRSADGVAFLFASSPSRGDLVGGLGGSGGRCPAVLGADFGRSGGRCPAMLGA